jgi:multidrug efflux pump subunit AcrA (membrane-fusion protein)
VVQNRAQAVPVVPGEIEAAQVAVSGALHEGDKVIVAGLNSLVDGYPVEIRQ